AAALLKAALAACRARGIACDAIDPAAVTDARLRAFRWAVIPRGSYGALAARAQRLGVRVAPAASAVSAAPHAAGTTVLRGPHGTFVVVENWSDRAVRYDARALGAGAAIAPF